MQIPKGFLDLMKTKLLILFTLATFVVGVFLLPNSVVFAHEIAPWNVQINVNFNGKKYSYNLWENAKNLPQNQLENRGVFLGLKGKNNLVDSLVLRGFSYRESACYVLVGASRFLQQMQADQTQRRDAIARFCPQNFKKFDYQQGKTASIWISMLPCNLC